MPSGGPANIRWAGVDYGAKRIGVALSDYLGSIASPATVLPGAGNLDADAIAVRKWAETQEVRGFVVGLPVNMDGSDSAQTTIARNFAVALQRHLPNAPVELFDERLTSFQADALMAQVGLTRHRQKRARDAIAAAVILQSFLDARANEPPTATHSD